MDEVIQMSEPNNQPSQSQPTPESPIKGGGESSNCSRCKRPLKNPIYRKIGMGKICLGKSSHPNKLELLKQVLAEEQKLREEKKAQKQQTVEKEQKVIEQAFVDNK